MIDLTSDFGQHVAARLAQEPVIWLTTVSADGTPQPNPVWFYWDGESFLIYTTPDSFKLKHLARNPRVSLSLEGATVLGGDVAVFTGAATVEREGAGPDPGYASKYQAAAREWGRTIDDLYQEYSVIIRVTPDRLRGFH